MKKRSKKNKSNIFSKLFSSVLFLSSVFFIGSIFVLDVLDLFYFTLVVVFVILINLIGIFFIKKGKLFGHFLVFVLIAIFWFLILNVNKTVDFLKGLELNYKTYNYSVIVLKESNYKNLNEISNLKLGYYNDQSSENKKALDKIRKKIEIEVIPYDDIQQLSNDLLHKKIDAALFENSYLDILNESTELSNFKSLIRKVYDFIVITKTSDFSKDIDVTREPFNVYVSGIDTYGEISSVSRSDVNMIVTVHPKTYQVLVTSIPRDYYVKLHGKNGFNDKLTHAGLYGIDMSIQTLEDLLNIKINYYVKVNFSSVLKIVDAIGGIRVYSDYDFVSIDNYRYKKGYNDLDGKKALSFVRERKAFLTGDRQRIINQQAVLNAVFDKVISKKIIVKYGDLLDSVEGSFVTNMSKSRLSSFIRFQLSNNHSWNLEMNALRGNDSRNYTYSLPSVKSYVMEPDSESIEHAHNLIEDVLNGDVINKDNLSDSAKEKNDNDGSRLKAKLFKDTVEFAKGETYIYYGYSVTYDDKDITNNYNLNEKFSINGFVFDDYRDLVSYVTQLDVGKYIINYKIQYKGEVVNLKQSVIVVDD